MNCELQSVPDKDKPFDTIGHLGFESFMVPGFPCTILTLSTTLPLVCILSDTSYM